MVTTAAVFSNTRDVAAPPLLFCAAAGLFFSDVFFSQYPNTIYLIYGLILFAIWAASQVYGFPNGTRRTHSQLTNQDLLSSLKIPTATLWLLSLPGLLANIKLVQMFGGPIEYLMAAKYGTRNFYGLGPIKTAISTIYPIGLCYFAYYICVPRRSRLDSVLFVAHMLVVLSMALLTLSRGTLLTHFVYMSLIWHVAIRKVSVPRFAILLTTALIAAGFYGVLRETFSFTDGQFQTGLATTEKEFKTEWMEFGTFPLQAVIRNQNDVDRLFGKTYLTVITNVIPRRVWPEKPNPGGVIFTRQYVPGLYDEYSDYTTGLFPEAIMNFGLLGGVAVGFLALFALTYQISKYHIQEFVRGVSPIRDDAAIRKVVIYVQVLWTAPLYLTGEFTNLTIGLSIRILVYVVFFWSLRLLRWQPSKRLSAAS